MLGADHTLSLQYWASLRSAPVYKQVRKDDNNPVLVFTKPTACIMWIPVTTRRITAKLWLPGAFGPSARASCMLRSRITRFADIEKGKHGNGEGDRNDVCIDRVAPIGCLWRRSAGIGGKPCGNWAWRRCKHQANIMWPRGSSGTGYSLATGPERIDSGPEVPMG